MTAGPRRAAARAGAWAAALIATLGACRVAVAVLRAGVGQAGPAFAPAAWLHQDLALAALFGLAAGALGRRPALALYALICAYSAANVPAAAVLGTPLTRPMLSGAGAALSDSIRAHLSPSAAAAAMAVLTFAALGARGAWSGGPGPGRLAAMSTALMALLALLVGPWAARSAGESARAYRNAVATLALTAWRQAERPGRAGGAPPGAAAALPAEGEATDLRALAGRAAGFNVLWVVLESAGAQYLRPYGAAEDPLPTVSRLAEGGLVFESAYCVYPESIKGLYALLCSAEPAAYTGAEMYAAGRLPCDSLAEVLARAGYRGAAFHSGRFVYLGMAAMVQGRGFDHLADAGDVGGRFASSFGVDEASTVASMLDWLDGGRGHPDQPFFLMYLPIAGHHPYESPGEGPRPFGEADDLSRYLSDLHRGDLAIRDLVEGLRRRGEMDRTLWVFSGDHGEAFFQHPGNFAHSLQVYEENVRVPLVFAAPGLAPARAPQIASTVDIAPTVLDLLGLARPAAYRGRSLLAPDPGTARFYTDHTEWLAGLRHGPWKAILNLDTGHVQLFDLRADPAERRDVSAAHAERAAAYGADLRRWAGERRAAIAHPPGP